MIHYQLVFFRSLYNLKDKRPKLLSPWSSHPWMWIFCVLWRFICVKTCPSFCSPRGTWTPTPAIILKLWVEEKRKLLVVLMVKAPDCNQRFTYTTDLTHLEEKVGDQDIDLLLTRSRGLYWGILAQSRGSTKTTGPWLFIIFSGFRKQTIHGIKSKRSLRQVPDQERTNRNGRIYLKTTFPDNNLLYTPTCGVLNGLYERATLLSLVRFTKKTFGICYVMSYT